MNEFSDYLGYLIVTHHDFLSLCSVNWINNQISISTNSEIGAWKKIERITQLWNAVLFEYQCGGSSAAVSRG
jgi:hypothetical protein